LYPKHNKEPVTLSYANPLTCVLQVQGYDLVNMHTNFARTVMSANQQSDDWQIVPTNIFWNINIVSTPGKVTYYDNYNTAGKIPYSIPIMEEIEGVFHGRVR
jgi:hypothetical protein